MSLNRKVPLLVAPPRAAIGAVIGFSVAAFAVSPSPAPTKRASGRSFTSVANAGDETLLDRVVADSEDDGDRCGRRLSYLGGNNTAARGDHGNSSPHQFGRQRRQPIDLIVGPAVFDGDVLAFDEACVFQALTEGTHGASVILGR